MMIKNNNIDSKNIEIKCDNENTMCNEIMTTIGKVLLTIIINWDTISRDDNIMDILNINKNTLCRNLKDENPHVADNFVQAFVLSVLVIYMYIVMSQFTFVKSNDY